jgi:hypothetical protein
VSRSQRILFVATALVAGATRLVALSRHPWDWDEILFCLALRDYNVLAHQPHPPGFPLFVALGRIAYLFFDRDFHALQAVNILAGIAVFPVTYWLGRALRMDFRTAYSAALLFAFIPNVWYFGGSGFSDVPATVLYLAAAAAFLSVDAHTPRRYFVASLLLGAAMLMRPHNALAVIYPWVAATVRLVRAGQLRAVIGNAVVVVLIVAAGYGIAAWNTGFDEYVHSLGAHAEYVRRADTIDNPARPPLHEVLRRQLDPYEAGKVSLLLNLLALGGIVFGRRRLAAEVLLTFGPYFVFTTFAASATGYSRLSIPYIAMIPLLAAEGIRRLAEWRPRFDLAVRAVFVAAIIGRIVWWLWPAFEVQKTKVPPPITAALWLRDHTDPKTAKIIVHDSMWPWARYYFDKHEWDRVGDDIGMQSDHDTSNEWLLRSGDVYSLNSMWFRRDQDRAWNLTPLRRYYEVHVQRVSDIAFFGSGWYQYEWDGPVRWRWMSGASVLMLPPLSGTGELRLRFSVPADSIGKPVRVSFTMNGDATGSVVVSDVHEHEVRYLVRGRANAPNVLRIEVSDTFVPAHRKPGDDGRRLGLRLWSWGWRRIGD